MKRKTIVKLFALLLALVLCAATLTSCGVRNESVMIFAASDSDMYLDAAKPYFKNTAFSILDSLDKPERHELEYGNGITQTFDIGVIEDDTLCVVIISSDEAILEREAPDGKHITFNVWDNGTDNIKIGMRYFAGDTDRCVTKGNLDSGEIAANTVSELDSSGVTDKKKRAGFIFNAIDVNLKDIGY